MIEPTWKRICGIHTQEDGTTGAVWLAYNDRDGSDFIQVYDSCVFKLEVMAVIAEGLNARGRWIPVSWRTSDKEMSDNLLERGCRMTVDSSADSDTVAEMLSRDIWERMRTGRLKVDKRLGDWKAEFESFDREKNKVNRKKYPLMSATRHAIANLSYAKRLQSARKQQINHPRLAIV